MKQKTKTTENKEMKPKAGSLNRSRIKYTNFNSKNERGVTITDYAGIK